MQSEKVGMNPAYAPWYEVITSNYEVIASNNDSRMAVDGWAGATLDSAKSAVRWLRELYPDVKLIFVRQYFRRRGGGRAFRVLHKLTNRPENVGAGSTE